MRKIYKRLQQTYKRWVWGCERFDFEKLTGWLEVTRWVKNYPKEFISLKLILITKK